jgi:hypothetical protein
MKTNIPQKAKLFGEEEKPEAPLAGSGSFSERRLGKRRAEGVSTSGETEMKNLRMGFSLYGALVVALQSLPNIVWALFPPAVNRLAGNASSVPFIEYGEHILGVSVVILLLFLVRRGQEKRLPKNGFARAAFVAIGLYWAFWACYFCGVQPDFAIYAGVILPPSAFFCSGLAEKVYPVSAASAVFLAFHLVTALENFPLSR